MTLDDDFSLLDEIFRLLIFPKKIVTSLPCFFTIGKISIKIIFAHNCFIYEPIFKIFAAHFTINLVLNAVKKTLHLPLMKL